MIIVSIKLCELCEKQPFYNIRGEKKGRFCADHKEPYMVNVLGKSCEVDGCYTRPIYNMRGEKRGRFCANHKKPDMVNIISKLCNIDGCNTRAWYGNLGKGLSHCASHKQKGMITSPTRKCETTRCRKLGTHEANGIRYCEDHMPPDSKNLGIEPCSSCGLDDLLTNGKCETCDPRIIQIRRHAKENCVKDIFTVAGFTFVHD